MTPPAVSLETHRLQPSEVFALIDFQDGAFIWKHQPKSAFIADRHWAWWNGRYAGKPVHIKSQRGYLFVVLKCRKYAVHRLVWLFTHGEWPEHQIDHIDGDRTNNAISNLRDVPAYVNCANTKISTRNTSGAVGVYWRPKLNKWEAAISYNKSRHIIGWFRDKREAVAARRAAEREFGFGPNHGRATI